MILTETTVSKLREMRLSVMANALKDQLSDPQFQNLTFEDRIGLLVDAEWNTRKNNHLNKLIRQATITGRRHQTWREYPANQQAVVPCIPASDQLVLRRSLLQ